MRVQAFIPILENAQHSMPNTRDSLRRVLSWTLSAMHQALKAPFDAQLFRQALHRWYGHHGRDLPWRNTRDPYAILVSEFMLRQTQVKTVIPYYKAWLPRFANFASLACASKTSGASHVARVSA